MKLTIPRAQLLQSLKWFHSICQRATSLPILKCLRVETTSSALMLSGTDLELGLHQSLPVQCPGQQTMIVPIEPVLDFIRALSGDTIDWHLMANQSLTIQSGKAKATFKLAASSEYPALPDPPTPLLFSISATDLEALLLETLPAVGENDSRYVFNAIRLSLTHRAEATLELVGTDGKRLVKTHRMTGTWLTQDNEPKTAFIPKKAGKLIAAMLSHSTEARIGIALSSTLVGFQVGSLYLTSRLMEGSYPSIDRAIPPPSVPFFTLPKIQFAAPLRRVSVINDGEGESIHLTVRGRDLILNAHNVNLGEATETIELPEPGQELTVGFNTQFLLDALASMPGDQCRLQMESPHSPCLVTTPERPEWQHVVMPLHTQAAKQ